MGLPGMFGDLPAIFTRNVTEDGLQVAQGMLMGFWTREVETQPRMQLTQVFVPPADLTERWPDVRRCGMLRGLHAVLAFDEGCQSRCDATSSMAHRNEKRTKWLGLLVIWV
jgi:hypothetical protein